LKKEEIVKTTCDSCILVFVKYPQKNKVKTRLSRDLGSYSAIALYARFVEDTLETLNKINVNKFIFYSPENYKNKFLKWLGNGYMYRAQKGGDLGERMDNAFLSVFGEGYGRIIILGSDSPDLPVTIIDKALQSLLIHDTVIGPSLDGGYYLLGFRKEKYQSGVFKKINWSSKIVFEKTMTYLRTKKLKTKILEKWRDIDTANDLDKVYCKPDIKY
jgi:rSAM/selenodomain-associated transferase 1